jgi:hypothetical protein
MLNAPVLSVAPRKDDPESWTPMSGRGWRVRASTTRPFNVESSRRSVVPSCQVALARMPPDSGTPGLPPGLKSSVGIRTVHSSTTMIPFSAVRKARRPPPLPRYDPIPVTLPRYEKVSSRNASGCRFRTSTPPMSTFP